MERRTSVIVPARDAGRFIDAAIRSIVPGIEGLDPTSVEVVVAIDRSIDDTVEQVAQAAQAVPFSVKVLEAHGAGASAARNSAIVASTGDTLLFLDADDLYVRGAVRRHHEVLDAIGTGLTFGGVVEFRGDPPDPEGEGLRVRHGPIPGTMAMDRSVMEHIGGFHRGDPLAEWPVTFDRLRRSGAVIGTTPGLVLLRRYHDRNLSGGGARQLSGYARGIKQVLDERRRAAAQPAAGRTPDVD